MQNSGSIDFKNCLNCNEKVYDLRGKSKNDIENWFQKEEGNPCVFIRQKQLSQSIKNKKSILDFKKIGIASILIGSSFLQPNLFAQEKNKNSFSIEQEKGITEKVLIEGEIKIKRFIGWKKLEEYNIDIYSGENLISELFVDKKGNFKLELDKKNINNKLTISIHASGFETLEIENIDIKNTKLKVYLDKKQIRFVGGRFF